MNPKIKELCIDFLLNNNADCAAVGIIDFKKNKYEAVEFEQTDQVVERSKGVLYFDLASVSKPLINSLSAFTHKDSLNEELILLLNHRASIPAWGLLPKSDWKEIISQYEIKESDTLYSDYSANRFMLELEKKTKTPLIENIKKVWDDEVVYWLDLNNNKRFPQFGFLNGLPNFGKVHDPNAYNIGEFTSHAGVFGTVDGVCRTLLNFNSQHHLLADMKVEISKDGFKNRFVMGWDRAQNPEDSLAGRGCSKFTFGHLGFTGTSIWIDPEKSLGHVILTNATKYFWYDKKNLPDFRKAIGELVWQS